MDGAAGFEPRVSAQWRVTDGAGEVIAALLLIPRTSSLGLHLTSAFWGGAICMHLAKSESFAVPSVLLLTWVGAWLRVPGAFASFCGAKEVTRQEASESKALVS